MKFTITNVSDQTVEVALIAGLPKHAEITLPQKIAAGQSASGMIKLRPEVMDQQFEKSFTLEVKGEKPTRFTVPVKRTMRTMTAAGGADTAKPAPGGGH
jgi:hypothetical protein